MIPALDGAGIRRKIKSGVIYDISDRFLHSGSLGVSARDPSDCRTSLSDSTAEETGAAYCRESDKNEEY